MARKAPQPPIESSSDDDEQLYDDAQPEQPADSSSSSGEEQKPPPKNPPTQKKPDPPRPSLQSDTDSDEEDEEDTPTPPKKTSTLKKPDPPKPTLESDSDSDSDEEEETLPSPPKKATTQKNSDAPKPALESESDSDSDDDEEETPPLPKTVSTQKNSDAPKPPLESESDSDSDDDEEETPPLPKTVSTQKKSDAPKPALESESDSDSDDDEETPPLPKTASTQKNPDAPKPALESESDSDSDEEEAPPPRKALTQKKQGPPKPTLESDKVKPIESKPMVKSKLPVTVLASPAVSLSNKRSRGSDATQKKKVKREKLEGSNDESGKKPLFQRIWSEEDEVVILQGMIDYKVKNGVDPMTVAENFLESIKESLHVDVNKTQLLAKIRALKKRFENSKKKKTTVDPHGIMLIELAKKIWDNDADVKSSVSGEGKASNSGTKKRKAGVEKSKGVKEDVNGAVSEDQKVEEEEKLQDLVISRRKKELKMDDLGNCGFVKDGVLKEMMNLLDEGGKAKIRDEWKKHSLEEMELYVKRLDILKEMTQLTLNAMKST